MQICHEDNLDGISNGLPIEPKEHKRDWLTLQAIFPLIIFLVLVAKAAATPAYPLRPSANGRYIVDNNGNPFLIIGDAPHSILNKLNNTDAATYIQSRASHGFNALWIELLCDSYTFGYGNEGNANYGRDVDGNNPFTSMLQGGYYDLTTPNAAYWSHVDYIVQTAAANGVQCYLTPLDQGGWTQTALTNGTTRCYQYGTFLGNRYKNFPNVIWNLGNDFKYWDPPGIDDATLAIADGIRSEDSKVLTTQFIFPASQSQQDPPWVSRINVNSVYSYLPAYDETYVAWNAGTIMPVLFAEGPYEDESGYGGYTGTPNTLRREEYWSLTSGALAGHMWGSYWIDRFDPAWQSHLNSQGTIELGYFKSFMTALHWYDLVPDQTHSLITAGYGTYTSTGTPESSNYATGAKTADGTLAVIYTPVSHTLTVVLGGFAGPVTAQWYDPTHNTFSTVSGSPFNNSGTHNFATPGNNHAGDPDWVLLLRTTPTPTPSPTAPRTAAVVDFNSDGHPDYVLYKTSTRQTAIWYLNNNVYIGGAYGPTLVAGWGLRGVADFNRDSHPDYALFAPVTTRTALWYLAGPTFTGSAYGPTLPSGWELVETADFNGDHKPDYVLNKASTGQTAIWYLNNNAYTGGGYGPTLPRSWNLSGVADFNRDGHPDYALFIRATGQTVIGYLSGLTVIGAALGPTVPDGWALVGTADFNGDGKPDFLLYKASTGQTAIWYLNNNIFVSGAYGPTLPAGWSLVSQ